MLGKLSVLVKAARYGEKLLKGMGWKELIDVCYSYDSGCNCVFRFTWKPLIDSFTSSSQATISSLTPFRDPVDIPDGIME